jgi:signal transduction histidine kinase/CheY-like chemotaxis protein
MQDKISKSDIDSLREKAIALLSSKNIGFIPIDSEEDKLRLIHELEVHQIELELQNEELQQAKSIALASADKYKELYDFAPTGFFTLSKTGEIVGLNLSGSNLLCKTRSKLMNSQFGFFVTDDTRPIFNRFLEKALNSKFKVACEVTLTTIDHKPIYAYISGASTENGEQCLINVMDITQNKMVQELIAVNKELSYQIYEKEILTTKLTKAKNKAEESERQKSAFLANMSHEIRTPLNGILGFSQLLKDYEKLDQRQVKYVTMIEQGGIRLLSIINNLIEISKIESGLSKVMISSCNVNDLIEYTYNFFKPEVETKGMKISFKVSLPEKEAFISTDREKIYAILSNLVKNAIKYSDEGVIVFGYLLRDRPDNSIDSSDTSTDSTGSPTTMTRDRSESSWPESPEFLFFVKDTGIGILPENLDSIFNRFDQITKVNTRTSQGSGLGLTIAKAYAEMLGGKLWVESKPGKGSTFYFTIPYNYVPKELIAKSNVLITDLPESKIKKLKILIVEDDEPSALLSTEIFQKYCRMVLYATNGVEAVDVFKNNPDIDLVLMDINMPVMNGRQATKKIRQLNKEVIIIAQSAHVFESDREKAIEAGCNAFLLKPVDRHQIFGLLISYFGV